MKEWLLADTPTSAFQAWAGRAYLGLLAFMKNRLAVLGLLIIGVLVVIAVLAPVIAPYDPVETNIGNRLQPLSLPTILVPTRWAVIFFPGLSGALA